MAVVTELASDDRVIRLAEEILERRGVRRAVAADDDLRELGLTSLDLVNLMLAVEAEFSLEIPDHAMTPANFRSATAIEALVASLRRAPQTAN
jgi:acyl carrier protein